MQVIGRISKNPLLVDAIFALALGALVTIGTYAASLNQEGARHLDAGGYALLWLASAPVAIRRRWPAAAVVVSFTVTMIYLFIDYPYGPIFFITMVTVYSAAAWRATGYSSAALAFCLLGHIPWSLWAEEKPDGLFFTGVTTLFWLAAPFAAGLAVRFHRESQAKTRLEHIYEERLRIAQEVHDVVGHSLAVISMNAGAALHVLTKQPGPPHVEQSLQAIREASSGALDELRSTLATFTGTLSAATNPGLELAPALVSASNAGGLRVDLQVTGDRGRLPSTVDLAGYRIMQEALANVVRHARADSATARIAYGTGKVEITVTDDGVGGSPGAGGSGLESMAERARSLGGSFRAGPRDGGGFEVHAVLPVEVARR